MTESFLLTFLENVYVKNINYCVVCLRTSEERRLTKPCNVKNFAISLNQPFMLNGPNHMACYICERQAAAALRYRKASSLATFALSVMAAIKNNHRKYDMIRSCTADEKNKDWLSSVLLCQSEMLQIRARSQLLLTEVLMVNSPIEQPQPSNVFQSSEDTPVVSIVRQTHITSLGESRDLYVVPDDAPRESASDSWELTQKPEEGMSSIIIFDEDDDDPININPEMQPTVDPIAIPSDPIPPQNIPLSVNTTNDTINNIVSINQVIQNTSVGELSMLNTNTVLQTTPTEFILHPIIFNSGMMTVPTLSANIVNGQLVTNNAKSPNLIGTPQLALQVGDNLDFISDPNKVSNVLRVLSHQDAAKVHIFTGAIPNTSQSEIQIQNSINVQNQQLLTFNKDGVNSLYYTNPSTIELGNTFTPRTHPAANNKISPPIKIPTATKHSSTSKNPTGDENPSKSQGGPALVRADRIDWEDKIPMDVISFVDKNDKITKRPRYSNNALGISDVVSLNDDQVIIDLC